VNARALVGKLNSLCRRTLEGAAGLCLSRSNYNVEVEHWLLKLMEPSDADFTRILRHYDINPTRVSGELTRTLDQLRTGNARAPELSLEILDLMREAWTLSSLEYGAGRVRSGYLLAALLGDRQLSSRMRSSSPELAKIPAEKLHKEVQALVSGSAEDQLEVQEAGAGEAAAAGGQRPAPGSNTPALDQFTLNLTERARKGEIDPVIGRDFEIRQVIDILTRRRQNNPILTGEAGVGKTAVVEGFALRVAAGDVPASLRNVDVRTLDLGLLQAGAGVKGEFENRLKSVIAEVKASPRPVILFIDEAHTIIGAGGAAGQGDAANLLKPALARGELRTIAATTWAEYKKFFETDAALKRRFQVVKVDEPDEDKAIRMMRGLTGTLEKHHKVRVLEEAVADSVKLSHRYITDRQLPDKSVSLLDTACARVALGQSATPPALEDCRREIEHLEVELGILGREEAVGADHAERLKEATEKKAAAEARLADLEKRWEREKELVTKIQEIRGKLEGDGQVAADGKEQAAKKEAAPAAKSATAKTESKAAPLKPEEQKKLRQELGELEHQLKKMQGESPLVQPVVDRQAVAEVVSGWTGIPVGKMVLDEIKTVLALQEKLEERIIGQSHALEAVAQRIRTARASLTDPRRPIGVFLMVGPSGVGKTETAMALADILYGGDRNMVVINMSEYKEDHKISRLTGSAPGYVGYGEGGVLTEAVRRKPYSIVLLDEVEKANVAVQEIFYQVFDKGVLQDDKGQDVDFKNTIILLTSNVGTDTIMKVCADPDTRPDAAGLGEALRPDLLKSFKPALLGRLTLVPYFPLSDEVLRKIVQLQLKRIGDRMRENHRATFSYDDNVVTTIAGRCKEVESGARNVDHILTGTLLPEISREFLARLAEGSSVSRVHVGVDAEGKFTYQIT
jgi:type VI secretion system protein VasG